MESEIQSLYVRYFGRPADYQGIDFWLQSIKSGSTIAEIKSGFEASPEFLGLYSNRSAEQIVNRAYQFLFGRSPDQGGLAFWSDHLRSQRLTLNSVLETIIGAAVSADKDTFAARTQAAISFTATLRQNSVSFNTIAAQETGRAWLNQINSISATGRLALYQLPVLIPRLSGNEPALVDSRIASAFKSMLSRLGANPTLRVFYDINGSGQTGLAQPFRSIPINDEIIGYLRLTFSKVDELVPSFQLIEATSPASADIEVHVVESLPEGLAGITNSLIATDNISRAQRLYSRIDILSMSGSDARYLVSHEVLHAFGGEHPFDAVDGDVLPGVSTADTMLAYQQSDLAVLNGYASVFTPLDEAVLRATFAS